MSDVNVKILLQNLLEKIKEGAERENASTTVDATNDVAVNDTQSLLNFSVSAVRLFQKAVAEVLAENASAEVSDEAAELTQIALSYQKGMSGIIDNTLLNLSVEKYCDNFSNICNVYQKGVVALEEKIAECEDFCKKTEEAHPNNEVLKGSISALKGAIRDSKERIRGFSQNKLGFKISRDKRLEFFNYLSKKFSDAVCNLEKKLSVAQNKVAELIAAQEKARREAEEAEKRKREELARKKVEKIAKGLSYVKPSVYSADDNQTFYTFCKGEQSFCVNSCERVDFERSATITLCQFVQQIALFNSPSGNNIVDVLKTNGVVSKDAQTVIVVDSGHKIFTSQEFKQNANAYFSLLTNEKLLFSEKAKSLLEEILKKR